MEQFIYPYIMFKDTRKAVDYYNKVFKGETIYTMLGKDTPNCPEDQLERIMHLEYKFQNTMFYFADDDVEDKGLIQLHLNFLNKSELQNAFNEMKKESTVIQELGETFWGAIFGVIKDPFGITWQFHYSLRHEK